MHTISTLAGPAAIILALGLIGLSLWSRRSSHRDDTEAEEQPVPEDDALEEPPDPADPRRKFSTRQD